MKKTLVMLLSAATAITAFVSLSYLDSNVAYAENMPTASGTNTASDGGATIDYSNTSDGYVMVKCSQSYPRVKAQVVKDKQTYTYDIACDGNYVSLPLQMGNGNYTVRLLKNVSGNKYAMLTNASFSVNLTNELSPYLIPSQIVNYKADSETVKKSSELVGAMQTDLQKVDAVYKYIINNITYDDAKAQQVVSKSYTPVVDSVLQTKKGICYDYSAVLATMLRSQGIPTKLITGYVSPSGTYHAWNEVYINGVGWVSSAVYFDGVNWKRVDSTFGASGKNSDEINKYIQNNSNYQIKYQY